MVSWREDGKGVCLRKKRSAKAEKVKSCEVVKAERSVMEGVASALRPQTADRRDGDRNKRRPTNPVLATTWFLWAGSPAKPMIYHLRDPPAIILPLSRTNSLTKINMMPGTQVLACLNAELTSSESK